METPNRGDARPSRFFAAVCDAAVHRALVELDETVRPQVSADVTSFVGEQLAALPLRLRLLFEIGMLGFRTLVLGATLRPFTALPAERRVVIFETWAYGRLAPARQLFRLVRTTALLACYEHPAMLSALEKASVTVGPEP